MDSNVMNSNEKKSKELKAYSSPKLVKAGSLVELTQGFSGSIPDEQGGHTKRNPFVG
ncbi:lasso RiPP family leader peptide-containing protein [Reinekea marinisedimentorum]|uniref:Lasso RiPP family leader peptide-containing protein n=1 Tax=Reinekea marinisedimentorum TaxID=230495 RepID=A0A4V2UIR3_9GAMM|nr:lasso RiPP family leader peptide-containing protein [Reinekea marinisedimentorum]TCS37160.1 hypothetical protein BCF53_12019 [Reinekea marinisedimentorum]